MTFNTNELGILGKDKKASIRALLQELQCKPVRATIVNARRLCNVYSVTDTLNEVAIYNNCVKRKVKNSLREIATKKFLEFLSERVESKYTYKAIEAKDAK